jgi:hypothetical protein
MKFRTWTFCLSLPSVGIIGWNPLDLPQLIESVSCYYIVSFFFLTILSSKLTNKLVFHC